MKKRQRRENDSLSDHSDMENPFNLLYQDCLQQILSFDHALEIWQKRIISKAWPSAAKMALQQVICATCSCSYRYQYHCVCDARLFVDLCKNKQKIKLPKLNVINMHPRRVSRPYPHSAPQLHCKIDNPQLHCKIDNIAVSCLPNNNCVFLGTLFM